MSTTISNRLDESREQSDSAGVVFQSVHCAPPHRRSLDANDRANSGGLCLRPL